MTNNKQQTAVEWLADKIEILHYDYWAEHISKDEKNQRLKQLKEQAKEMEEEKLDVAYGNGYEQGEMDFYKKMQGKGNQYADGYAEGYKRALELTQWAISNLVPSQNESK